jgi:D-lactate dehydrogenase
MRVAVYSTRPWDEQFLSAANSGHDLLFLEARLDRTTTPLAEGARAVCVFVNDVVDRSTIEGLHRHGIEFIALRSAGFNHVDVKAALDHGMTVVRVPAYSPHAVAEHAVALVLTLNRKLHRAHARVREGNFSLDGLLGFDLHGKTVGVIGTGQIGRVFVGIMLGFGCRVLAHDRFVVDDLVERGVRYVDLDDLFAESHIVALHLPLTSDTYHLIDTAAIARMRPGVMLVNTSRGALVDARALIEGLKSGRIGSLGLDVYEEEADLFFEDLSDTVIQDDVFARLLTFPNVLVTGHQGFFTREALDNIARTTLANATAFEDGRSPGTEVTADLVGS